MHHKSNFDVYLKRDINFLNSLIPEAEGHQSLPEQFQLPSYYTDDPYRRSWPDMNNPDPYKDDSPFGNPRTRIMNMRRPNHFRSNIASPSRKITDVFSPIDQSTSREYYADRSNILQEALMIRDSIQGKDRIIMLLTMLAVVEGIVILSMARRERRGVV